MTKDDEIHILKTHVNDLTQAVNILVNVKIAAEDMTKLHDVSNAKAVKLAESVKIYNDWVANGMAKAVEQKNKRRSVLAKLIDFQGVKK